MAKQQNVDTVAYIDDYLVISDSYDKCLDDLRKLITLLRELGFSINYDKVVGPSQRLTFLGIVLDTNTMTLELPGDKLNDLSLQLREFYVKDKVTKQQLQSLGGKLNWCTQVIYGGRYHMRRIFDKIKDL